MSIERSLFILLLSVGLSVSSSAQTPDCKSVGNYYNKKVCSGIENNQASFIKDLMQRRSSSNSLDQVLRKVVFENALNICFFFVYDARVDMNTIERDGRTLIDWLQDDTEKAFDAAFETENEQDKKYLIKQIQTGQKYFNIFRNNGAKFRQELR